MVFAAGSIFDPIYNFFGTILAFFYGIIPNLGVSIILLTVVVMLVLFPLTAKQAKSMMPMQRAQPEIKKLQAKYKNDRAKLNEEMMKFYQENKINPLAGCLPAPGPDADLPRAVPRDARARTSTSRRRPTSTPRSAPARTGTLHTNECNVPKLGAPEPAVVPRAWTSRRARPACHRRVPRRAPLLHPRRPRDRHRLPPGPPEPAQRAEHDSQMAMISTVLPIAFGLFSLQFPAGLVLYFLVSNLWRLGQQELIMRKITRPGQGRGRAIEAKARTSVIDVEERRHVGVRRRRAGCGSCSSSRPRANGDEPNGDDGNGASARTGPRSRATPGARQGERPRARQADGAQPGAKPTTGSRARSTWSGCQRAPRRRNNKKRKAALTARSRRTSSPPSRRHAPQCTSRDERSRWSGWRQPVAPIAEALDAALDELGVDEDDVEYEVLEQPEERAPRRGFGGSGGPDPRSGEADLAREAGGAPAPQPPRRRSAGPRSDGAVATVGTGGSARPAADESPAGAGAAPHGQGRSRPEGAEPSESGAAARRGRRGGRAAAARRRHCGGVAAAAASECDARQRPTTKGNTVDTIEHDVPIEEQAEAAEGSPRVWSTPSTSVRRSRA